MFGYVKIYKPQLRICEYEAYKAVYCTLCRALGRSYGPASHFILSYDYTFVTMLHMAQNGCSLEYDAGRCVFNPMKKCGRCKFGRESFDFSAALTVIMFYYKCADGMRDSGFFGKILYGLARLIASPWRRKAAKRYPDMDGTVSRYINDQFEAEHDPACSLDRAAEPTARAMSEIFSSFARDDAQKRLLADFGYYAGRWVYMIDACDDLEKDLRRSSFNPLITLNNLTAPGDQEGIAAARLRANESMNMTLARAMAAYNLLELGEFAPILDNVLHLGMAESQRMAIHEKELNANGK